MAFVNHICNLQTGWCQMDKSLFIYFNMFLFAKILHSNTNTGFLKTKLIGNIYGTHYGQFLA